MWMWYTARQPRGCISWLCWGEQGCRLRACSGCSQLWWGRSPSMPAQHGTPHWRNSSQTNWRASSNGPWRSFFQIYRTERRWRSLDCPRCLIVVSRFADSFSRPCCGLDTVSTTSCPRGGTWATAWEITACSLHCVPDMRDLSGHWSPKACSIGSDF